MKEDFKPSEAAAGAPKGKKPRGSFFRVSASCLAFAGASFLLPALLAAFAPAELEPLRASDADMWRWALSGHFPLVEAAREEKRAMLTLLARAQTLAGEGLFVSLACYSVWRGFVSDRIPAWRLGFSIAGVCLLLFAPVKFSALSPQTIDYAITSSQANAENAHPPGREGRTERRWSPFGAIYGADGWNHQMSPAVFLFERGLFGALFGAFLALCLHGLGRHARVAMSRLRMRKSTQHKQSADAGARHENVNNQGSSKNHSSHRRPLRKNAPQAAHVAAYRLLGVSVGASRRDIDRAYRQLMKRAHPDRGGSVEHAAAINQARDVLLRSG
jgi:hypothetical protein